MKITLLFSILIVVGVSMLRADVPDWWPNAGTQQEKTLNYAPANLGQLKNFAVRAKAHLDASLLGGAGFAVDSMVAGFGPDDGIAYTQAEKEENYKPVNVGQLKAVAKPFYDRLKAAGFDIKGNLSTRLSQAWATPVSWSYDVPWNPWTARENNYGPANIGQLKFLFNFDLSGFDVDQDGMSDAWETAQFGNLSQDGNGDFDGDGVVDRSEFLYRGNPKLADSDYDGRSDIEELSDGTNPSNAADVKSVRLGYFAMSDSALLTEDGNAPKISVSNTLVTGRKASGLSRTGSGSKLIYQHTETGGAANINLQKGSVRFWIKPNWSSGAGPGSSARLIECGEYSGAANIGWWCIYISADGTSLRLVSQDGLGHTRESLICNISWNSGLWYQVVVTYDGTGSALFVNGAHVAPTPAANGLGITYLPPQTQRERGVSIGADLSGNQGINAIIDEVETFNYRLSADHIAADYGAEYALGTDANGNGLPDAWDTTHFAGITQKNGAQDDYDGDGLTNYEEWQRGTNPKDTDTDYDGRSDAMEVADNTNPLSDASAEQVQLGYFPMSTVEFLSDVGDAPLQKGASAAVAAGRIGNGLDFYYSGATDQFLRYKDVEVGGKANINFRKGTVRLWYKPYWSSNSSGTPSSSSPLIACGVRTTNATQYFWALTIESGGGTMKFLMQDANGNTIERLSEPLVRTPESPYGFEYNKWYEIVLVYGPSASKLYINGVLRKTGSGSTIYPSAPVRALGFSIGTNRTGGDKVWGTIDEVETFNYELSQAQIEANYAARSDLGVDLDGDGLKDSWEMQKFGSLSESPEGDSDHDGLSNRDEFAMGLDPKNSDTDWDGISDLQEMVDNTDPLDFESFTPRRIAKFTFDSSDYEGNPTFLGPKGLQPISSTGIEQVVGRRGKAAKISDTGDQLIYPRTNSDGSPNISLRRGTVRLWVRSDWSTTQMSGSLSTVVSLGNRANPASAYWQWRFHDTAGFMYLDMADGASPQHLISSPFTSLGSWAANTWMQIVVTYSPGGGRKFYVNGTQTAGHNVTYDWVPKLSDLDASGVTLGSLPSGPLKAAIDEVEFFNFVLTSSQIASDYNSEVASYLDAVGNGMPDAWEIAYFGSVGANPSADPDGDGMTNAQEALFGTNPNLQDSDGDGRNDLSEIQSGSDPMVVDAQPESEALYPINVAISKLNPGQYLITWENRDTLASRLIIQRTEDGLEWRTVGATPGNRTSFTDSSGSAQKVYFYRVGAER